MGLRNSDPLLDHRAPGLVSPLPIEQPAPVGNGTRIVAVLFLGNGEQNARLDKRGIECVRLLQRVLRRIAHHAALLKDEGLAIPRQTLRRGPEQPNGLTIRFGRVFVALHAEIDWRDHIPTLAFIGMRAKPRLHPRNQRRDIRLGGGILQAGGKGLIGKTGRAIQEVDADGRKR